MAEHQHSSRRHGLKNQPPEGFKEVPGYEERYYINENAEIWSRSRNRLMKPCVNKTSGYPEILLQTPAKGARATNLHYLMRLTWMPSAPGPIGLKRGQWCVNHIDGNKLNNHASNLEWVTCEENVRHAWATGLNRTAHGEGASNAQFTSEQVREIRLRLINGEKARFLSEEYNCGLQSIKAIKKFASWKHQDHDLVVPLMAVCKSKWLHVMKIKLETGERMEECCNRKDRGQKKWNEDSFALYL